MKKCSFLKEFNCFLNVLQALKRELFTWWESSGKDLRLNWKCTRLFLKGNKKDFEILYRQDEIFLDCSAKSSPYIQCIQSSKWWPQCNRKEPKKYKKLLKSLNKFFKSAIFLIPGLSVFQVIRFVRNLRSLKAQNLSSPSWHFCFWFLSLVNYCLFKKVVKSDSA